MPKQKESAMPWPCNVPLVYLWGSRYRATRCRSAHTQDGQCGPGTPRAYASNYLRHSEWCTCVHWLFAQCRREGRRDKLCMASCTKNHTQLLANAYLWCSLPHVSRIERTRSMTLNSHKTHCDASMCYSAMQMMMVWGSGMPPVSTPRRPNGVRQGNHKRLISTTSCDVL